MMIRQGASMAGAGGINKGFSLAETALCEDHDAPD